jgi:flagellar motor switch protein FliM
MIEPIRNVLSSGFQSDALEVDHAWQRRVREIIIESSVDLTVRLGKTEITGERLIYLKPGAVIQLDQNADETLTALVEGVAKIKGYAGVQRGFQAFKVMKKLSLEEGRSYG